MWAVAVRTLGDREEAADALQDALISAYRAADRFRGDSAVTTWLHRIVVNACLDRVRRAQARPTTELPEIEVAAPSRDVDTVLDVRSALGRLPADQRVAIILVDMQGLAVAEAAEVLGVPIGTVKSRCARGRARLAVILGYLRNPEDAGGVSSDDGAGVTRETGGRSLHPSMTRGRPWTSTCLPTTPRDCCRPPRPRTWRA